MARGYELAFSARKRRVIDAEDHCNSRFVYGNRGQRLRIFDRRDRFADIDSLDSRKCHNLAHAGALCQLALQALENVELLHSSPFRVAFMPGDHNFLVLGDLAGEDAANRQAPNIFVVIDIRHQQLQRIVSQRPRRRN